MAGTYKIVRFYQNSGDKDVVQTGLTLERAQAHCQNPETSSSTCTNPIGTARTDQYGPWFDGYTEE